METTTETTVERELAIDASPETVWEFLVDPEKLSRWFGSRAWLDPRPDKLVLAPRRWMNDPRVDDRDVLPSGWIRV